MSKIAVILFNLGGPDSKEAIKPFLFNFFTDPAIIGAPKPIRWLLAKYISIKRTRREAGDSYACLGYKSPLLENSQRQAVALEKKLNSETAGEERAYRCFVSMRYWHPRAAAIVRQVMSYAPDEVVLLPLYPQFSTTTTGSSLKEWEKEAQKAGLAAPVRRICCYPFNDGFIRASADLVKKAYEETAAQAAAKGLPKPRVLFSAHGLPEKIIQGGDPYQWQCEQTAEKIAAALGIKDLDWQICYQSRVGPLKWIGPATDEAIAQAGADGVPVVIYPHAFVSEHVETLVEIDEEYREMAESRGVPLFTKVDTVGENKAFIDGLAALVKEPEEKRLCPAAYKKCCRA